MEKLELTGRNLGRVFNSRSGCVGVMQLHCSETKLPNLMLKTRPKQLLGSLPLDIALPGSFWGVILAFCFRLILFRSNAFEVLTMFRKKIWQTFLVFIYWYHRIKTDKKIEYRSKLKWKMALQTIDLANSLGLVMIFIMISFSKISNISKIRKISVNSKV